MIKVNLLVSVTDRSRSVAAVEQRVTDPRTRSWILMGSVVAVMLLAMLVDYVSANYAHRAAQEELERQQQIAQQMAAINREQADLEKKIKDIQARIDAIKRLRASQQGPVGMLSAINERLPSLADFRLDSVEQKDGELTIQGYSPNEAAVTRFGRSLEFSSGLFTNVSMETSRGPMEPNNLDFKVEGPAPDPSKPDPALGAVVAKLEAVKFTIKCKYAANGAGAAPPKAAAPAGQAAPAANQVAQK